MRVKTQVIRQHRPVRDLVLAGVAVIAMGASAYALYMNSSAWAQEELSVLSEERDELMITVEALSGGNTVLRERVAILERAQQVEGKAYEDVDVHLRGLQDEVLDSSSRGFKCPSRPPPTVRLRSRILSSPGDFPMA